MGPRILNTHARAKNKYQIWIAYDRGPAKNKIRFILSLIVLRAHTRNIPAKCLVSVHLDEMSQNAASDQGLQCLPLIKQHINRQ